MHHNLKIDRPYYEAILAGKKNFEIRNNDRGFNAGDTVALRASGYEYITATIGYVTNFAQRDGFVVFSLLDIKGKTDDR